MTSPASAASSSRRCSAWTASSRRSPASRSSSSGQSMSGGGSGPVYVEGRIGLRGLAGLYAEAFGRLRRSAHLRASYLFWIALGLAFTEAFSVSVAHLQSTETERWAAAAALGWWLFPSLVLGGGVALLVTPTGDRIDHIGVPNGLTALRAYSCLPLLLTATLSTPG